MTITQILVSPQAQAAAGFAPIAPAEAGGERIARVLPVERTSEAGRQPQRSYGRPLRPEGEAEPQGAPDSAPKPRRAPSDVTSRTADGRLAAAFEPSSPFMAQLIAQDPGVPEAVVDLSGHRDGPAMGSDAYRRIGATPPLYSEEPAYFRIAV